MGLWEERHGRGFYSPPVSSGPSRHRTHAVAVTRTREGLGLGVGEALMFSIVPCDKGVTVPWHL